MANAHLARQVCRALPADVAVLCADCGEPVPLAMFALDGLPIRQVRCPACACEVVLRDAW